MSDRAAESPAGICSGLFLLPRAAGIALPVPRQACLGLARAVLAEPGPVDPDGVLGRNLLSFSGGDPAVAVWLASHEREAARRGAGAVGSRSVGLRPARGGAAAGGDREESLLVLFGAAIVVPGPGGRDGPACVGMAAWEAFLGRHPAVQSAGIVGAATVWLDRLVDLGESAAQQPSRDAPAGGVTLEALVLLDAVARAVAATAEASRFDAAVAEARLEAMRELAYGAGHEINNPLANIATRAQALLLEEADADRRRRLSTIVDQAFRARDMIGGLMLFARPPRPQPAAVDAVAVVAAAIEQVRPVAAARGAGILFEPPETPIEVVVDRVQVEEAVRGVVVNAIEAVEHRAAEAGGDRGEAADGGDIAVVVRRHQVADGAWCRITVVDWGRGMDADTIRRAFDPFFSGREAGRGAGLGLSKAWRLIEASGGEVVLESRPGQGTQVTILLPLAR